MRVIFECELLGCYIYILIDFSITCQSYTRMNNTVVKMVFATAFSPLTLLKHVRYMDPIKQLVILVVN